MDGSRFPFPWAAHSQCYRGMVLGTLLLQFACAQGSWVSGDGMFLIRPKYT